MGARQPPAAPRYYGIICAVCPPTSAILLRDRVGTAEEPGELLRMALQADADALAERLRTESPAASAPGQASATRPGQYHVTRQGDSSSDWTAWEWR
jgi:hypothetical protein